MKLHLIPAFIATALISISCSGSKSDTITVDADNPEFAHTHPDMPQPEPLPDPVKQDTVLTHDVASAEEAIAFMESSDYADQYAQGILPAMAHDNLDYAIRLLKSPYNYFIVVDKPSMYVVLYNRFGVEQQAYRMACSKKYGTKHKRRDNRTPEGFFSAEGIYNSTEWLYTDDDGNTSQVKGQFGPRFIRLKTDVTTQIGIHGTCAPWALGNRASHGCIRIHNDHIMELIKYVEPGTPIIVNPSERDQKVNREEGYEILSINIGKPLKKQPAPVEEKKPQQKADTTRTDTIATVPASEPQSEPSDSLKHSTSAE